MSSKVLLEMNIIILPYAGVPSYYFFIDQGQYLAQSLVVVKKKKRKNKTGTKRFCNRRTVVIFLHILKITSVILWHDRCVVIICWWQRPLPLCISVYTNSVSLAPTFKGEKPSHFFHHLWKLLYHFTVRDSAKSHGSGVCVLSWVCTLMG